MSTNTVLLARNLAGKVVVVTGVGGSIVSELCCQDVLEKSCRLVMVDHNELVFTVFTASCRACAQSMNDDAIWQCAGGVAIT